jgi:hypothetical protein
MNRGWLSPEAASAHGICPKCNTKMTGCKLYDPGHRHPLCKDNYFKAVCPNCGYWYAYVKRKEECNITELAVLEAHGKKCY